LLKTSEKGDMITMSKYVIVDLEMCKVPRGFKKEEYHYGTELIQIGAVLVDENLEITERFRTYVKPQYGMVDRFIQNLTGITRKDTDSAPTTKEALEMFVEWIPEDAVLVSWSDNDEKQVRKEVEAKNIEIPRLDELLDSWEDCQQTFAEKMNRDKHYNLTEALNLTGLDYEDGAHDALVDAYNTALLFVKMKKEPKLQLISCYMMEEDDSTMYSPIAEMLSNFKFATC